jgi:hypothetical protein
MKQQAQSAEFKMLRYFSITSLLCILVAGTVLVGIYRKVAIRNMIDLGERSNLVLAKAVLNTVRPELVDYLTSVADVAGKEVKAYPISDSLERAIQDIMKDTTVVRIKLYNRRGTVAFSTKTSQIGGPQSGNLGFRSAIHGSVASKLVYRDTFNRFDRETEEDNLIQSYVPVRLAPTAPTVGVFEVYTDVSPLVHRTERVMFLIIGGVAAVLLQTYREVNFARVL